MGFDPYDSATRCTDGPTDGARAMLAWCLANYPEAWSGGIYNCRDIRGGTTTSLHGEGRAADVMFPGSCDDGGWHLVRRIRPHGDELGVISLIFCRRIWSARSPGGRHYGGAAPHRDHVHIGLSRAAGRNLTIATIAHHLGGIVTGGDGVPRWRTNNMDGLQELWECDKGSGKTYIAGTQGRLADLGYNIGEAGDDGYYGRDTEHAVRSFQDDRRLLVDGIAGPVTRAALWGNSRDRVRENAPGFPLPHGHWFGPESDNPRNHSGYWRRDRDGVWALQTELRQRGWSLKADGFYGPVTERTVEAFQRDSTANGWWLADDGLVGTETWLVIWERPIS